MPLLYFHNSNCISPQQTFPVADLDNIRIPEKNILEITEPDYEGIPPGILRRMGKAIRMGVGAAFPLMQNKKIDGIIVGTCNGGMEDCIKFLNQVIDYNEGRLTPGNFVGSTANAISSQLGLLCQNKGYNSTHVQSGLSFENALLDAAMLIKEKQNNTYLVGGVDEISAYNYNIDKLNGWYKKHHTNNFYENSEGYIPGEGAAMFLVNAFAENARAQLDAIDFFHTEDPIELGDLIAEFINTHAGNGIDLVITGENGDNRYDTFYDSWRPLIKDKTVARYKHVCGEFATASAVALWLAVQIIETQNLPAHMISQKGITERYDRILICNHFRENQHSLMLVSSVN